ncbi:dATP/dGTP pyrophosphohydrolase domain-containing protein [Variovorax sp. E3]|uniref:dATP/dGTP pyrophosphohydrolase domain-containing protein n=1 Tax=Variovorax sp. E3 TaxID=1914993 RepID=UPI0018DDFFF6|nr:dATP/dGTP pyrophosphohydrolase domain-containing protein [Variovorax sp. E3]
MLPLMTEADLRHLANTSAPITDQERAQAADNIRTLLVTVKRQSNELAQMLLGQRYPFDLVAHLNRQREFSAITFGPGVRTAGVVDHIRKELAEIEGEPFDVREWIDVVLLAFDGAWRTGATPEQIVHALVERQTRNESRTWPDWRTADLNKAIEHDRSGEAADASA